MPSPRLRTTLTATLSYAAWLTLFYWAGAARLAAFSSMFTKLDGVAFAKTILLPPVLFFAFGTLLIRRELPKLNIAQLTVAGFFAALITAGFFLLLSIGLLVAPYSHYQQYAYWIVSLWTIAPGLIAAQVLRFPRDRSAAAAA